MNLLRLLALVLIVPMIANAKIQNEDVKSEAELTGAGGLKSQLINDTKIYVTVGDGTGKRLDEAILDGDIGGSPLTTDGDLFYFNTDDARLPIGTEGQVLKVVNGLPVWGASAGGDRLNLVEFPSFENGNISEGTCTDCTATSETSIVLKTANNLESLKLEATSANATYIVDKAATTTIFNKS